MTVVAGLIAGAGVAWMLVRSTGTILASPVLQRENYRGARLPTAAGFVLVAAVVAVAGPMALLSELFGGSYTSGEAALVAALVSFGFLGLVDDLVGDGGDRGLKGHLRAAAQGRVTTGFVKLAGGAAVGLLLAAWAGTHPAAMLLVDAALIALAANFGNLLDRAPGRTLKWGLLAYLPLAFAAGPTPAGRTLAVVAGAAAALMSGDLKERFMLGDTGANAFGAALGLGTVLVTGVAIRIVVAGGLLALTLLSEMVSFGRVIDSVPPLRAMDRLGRLPEGEVP